MKPMAKYFAKKKGKFTVFILFYTKNFHPTNAKNDFIYPQIDDDYDDDEDDDDVLEVKLNLTNGEKNNIFGIHAFISAPFIYGDEEVEVVVIQKQVNDIDDVRDTANHPITMTLLEDGSGIDVVEPSMPSFMLAPNGGLDLYEDCKEEMAKALLTKHMIQVAGIKNTPSRKTNKYRLKFPPNIRCKMGYMNEMNGNDLHGHVTVVKKDIKNKRGKSIVFTNVTIRFMAVIQTSAPKLIKVKEARINDIETF